jgi:hypothetical protein
VRDELAIVSRSELPSLESRDRSIGSLLAHGSSICDGPRRRSNRLSEQNELLVESDRVIDEVARRSVESGAIDRREMVFVHSIPSSSTTLRGVARLRVPHQFSTEASALPHSLQMPPAAVTSVFVQEGLSPRSALHGEIGDRQLGCSDVLR